MTRKKETKETVLMIGCAIILNFRIQKPKRLILNHQLILNLGWTSQTSIFEELPIQDQVTLDACGTFNKRPEFHHRT